MAKELGFEKIRYSHSPVGGAPETLIGLKAPNFKLDRIAGESLRLQDFIDDKPALITFWGLACGPCRKEAPHLTKLHEQHGDAFSIVAVNAYDDDAESVAEYVENAKLSHPIVLQGSTVANKQYRVGAYPTTFWVDRNGIIEDYEVGFSSAERLEKRVTKMIDR